MRLPDIEASVELERCRDPGARPELHLPSPAAQTRIVSVARIRLDSRKSVRPFKGIICADISEFESSHPSHAVRSLPANTRTLRRRRRCVTLGEMAGTGGT